MIDPDAVAFDVDGVVADTMNLFLEIAREKYHINSIRYEDITCYNLADCLDMELDIIDRIVIELLDGNHGTRLRPLKGAAQVLQQFVDSRRPVIFVTARPYIGTLGEWFENVLGLDPAAWDLVATGTHDGKAQVLLERGISYFVDDRLETCYGLHDAGIVPVLFKQPWNREPHSFIEISSWAELNALIDF
jgi:5'(3')-deoxyribonucleotidase